jgi:hypothetical protein
MRISQLSEQLIRISEALPTFQVGIDRVESAIQSSLPSLQSSICMIAEEIPALRSSLVLKAELDHSKEPRKSTPQADSAVTELVRSYSYQEVSTSTNLLNRLKT